VERGNDEKSKKAKKTLDGSIDSVRGWRGEDWCNYTGYGPPTVT